MIGMLARLFEWMDSNLGRWLQKLLKKLPGAFCR